MEDNPVLCWASERAMREASRDKLSRQDRFGQLIGLAFIAVFLMYFAALYTESTGFFTSDFTAFGAILFFGGGIYGISPTLIRFATGRKNPARPADALGSALITAVCVYMLVVFPLDFSHLGDLLPHFLESIVEVVTNGIAKILIAIGAVVSPVLAVDNLLMYFAVRRALSVRHDEKAAPRPPAEGT